MWTQRPNGRPVPPIRIDREASADALRGHVAQLQRLYGDVLIVSLSGLVGPERELSQFFREVLEEEGIEAICFDVHRVGRGNFGCLESHLLPLVQRRAESVPGWQWYGSFSEDRIVRQTGVVRSNCLDCIDRTGLWQMLLARWVLGTQVPSAAWDSEFRRVWADVADALSLQYSGSPSLLGGLVRNGYQTLGGRLRRVVSSSRRYYAGICRDGSRQDQYSIVTQVESCERFKAAPGGIGAIWRIVRLLLVCMVCFWSPRWRLADHVNKPTLS